MCVCVWTTHTLDRTGWLGSRYRNSTISKSVPSTDLLPICGICLSSINTQGAGSILATCTSGIAPAIQGLPIKLTFIFATQYGETISGTRSLPASWLFKTCLPAVLLLSMTCSLPYKIRNLAYPCLRMRSWLEDTSTVKC